MASLYYVMGPSGAGKDSILSYARERLGDQHRSVFAHRYITRPAGAGGENHIELSEAEFARREGLGLFCMDWGSHSLRYGIGVEVKTWLELGLNVVMNGSRGYLEVAKGRFSNLKPVLITVDPEILRERLVSRGRESMDEIEKRIQRTREIDFDEAGSIVIRNNGTLEEAGNRFLELLRAPLWVGAGL